MSDGYSDSLDEIEEKRPYMDIYSKPGTKVRFMGKGGLDHEKEDAQRFLKVGKLYTVKNIIVGRFCSWVYLEEFPEHQYNTDLFFKEKAKWD